MTVTVDPERNEVVMTTASGTTMTLTWSAALLLGTLLREASVEAEPIIAPGKCYAPTLGHGGV